MNIFELLIYAIIAIILVSIVLIIFSPPSEDKIIQELRETMVVAQTNDFLGKTVKLETKLFPKEFYLSKTSFEDALLSAAIECNNPKICCIREAEQDKNQLCEKNARWDYDFLKLENETTLKTSIRCLNDLRLPICRIYIGSYPAQAKIVEIKKSKDEQSGKIVSTITVKNTGETQLNIGQLQLTLQKNVLGNWEDTQDTTQYEVQEIQYLLPQQEHTFIQEININTIGKYRLLYKFSGINAGYDENSLEIDFLDYPCSIIEEENYEVQTIEEGKIYREIKKCENCNYAYECASEWQTKFPSVNYQVLTKDKTYCEKTIESGTCESEAI